MQGFIRKLDELYKMIPKSVKGFTELGANLAGIITACIGVIGTVTEVGVNLFIGKEITDGWQFLIIFALIFSLARMGLRLKKRKRLHDQERYLITQNYYQFLHDYRNEINELECLYKDEKLTEELLMNHVVTYLEKSLNYLVNILSELSEQKISGCIKIIIGGGFNRISYEDAAVATLIRSSNAAPERRSLDVQTPNGVKIKDNTDFMSIVAEDRSGNDSSFYQRNLKEFDKQMRAIGKVYKNTTERWEDFYIGTIVVPIRISNRLLFYTPEQDSYNILGFLCVDSMSEDAFPMDTETKRRNVYILKAFAAIIYNVLSKNQFYLQQLNKM